MKYIDILRKKHNLIMKIALGCFSMVLVLLNILKSNNNVLWCDEIASVVIAKKPFWELVSLTAHDVHPPLYYLILRALGLLFGFSGPVMHLGSVIPYALILLCSLTIVWKKFGNIVSSVLIFLSSLLFCSIHFNVEIRMYSWASFFVLMSFVYFREVLKSLNYRNAILFVTWSLLAAYTHYFCIITVAPFYLTIIIIGMRERGKCLKQSILIWALTIIFYLPWAISFFINYSNTASKIYSARYNSILQCVEYIFSSKFSWLLLVSFLTLVFFSYFSIEDRRDFLWVSMGVSSIVLTIMIPYIISEVISPIMEERHVYPSFIIAWLLFGFCISKMKYKWYIFLLVSFLIVPFGISAFQYSYMEEKEQEKEKDVFIEKTYNVTPESGPVISDEWQIAYPILDYYYPEGMQTVLIEKEDDYSSIVCEMSSKNMNFWLFIKSEITEETRNLLFDSGYKNDVVIENGLLGSHRIWVYRCFKG